MALSAPHQQHFTLCRDKGLPKARSTKSCGNKALGVCIVAFGNVARAGTLLDVPLITVPKQNANLQDKDAMLSSGVAKGHVKVIHSAFCSEKYFHNS